MNKPVGIYIHIPFCESKCIYCDFASVVAKSDLKQKYVLSLIKEIENSEYDRTVKSIYIGGGTPSILSGDEIKSILDAIKMKFKILPEAEITIECNPSSIDMEKLSVYREIGINRISFGVQSLNDKLLKFLGRAHTKEVALSALKIAHIAGFDNISADLLIGIPGQTSKDLIDSLKLLIKNGVTHISAYMLQIEEGTLLFKMIDEKQVSAPDDDKMILLYQKLFEFLKKNGFERYEVSNFSKPGFESRHNQNYWKRGEYLGFGLAAHSFIDETRFFNPNSFDAYFDRQLGGKQKLTQKEKIIETIMLGLRCREGVSLTSLKKLGYDIKNEEIKRLCSLNILTIQGDFMKVTDKHFGMLSSIICRLIP